MPKTLKRIHSVTIKRTVDFQPDTSFIGRYTNHDDAGQFTIDRKHQSACPLFFPNDNDPNNTEQECTCDEQGDWVRGELQYFIPATVEAYNEQATWIPKDIRLKRCYWHDAMVSNARNDYARMSKFESGDFCFIGISAEADYKVGEVGSGNPEQTITSGGLWGIESDSDASYLAEIEQEQLSELREQLHAIGFSYRAISAAFKNVERKED